MTMQLTFEHFAKFLGAKNIKRTCEQCGAESWAFIDQPDSTTTWAIDSRRNDGSLVAPAPGIPCVAMCCNNCSFVKLFASIPIERWVKEQEGAKK